jgi:tetratricopeptide (TPR) repeat protein
MRMRAHAIAIAASLALAATAHAQVASRMSYREILNGYRAGRTDTAVRALLSLGADAFRQARTALESRSREGLDVRAAAMLHTDAADGVWFVDPDSAADHLGVAMAWADTTEMPAAFRRHWYLAAGLLLVEQSAQEGQLQPAFNLFERACRMFPDDVPILTVMAWLEERAALTPAMWNISNDPNAERPRRLKRMFLDRAETRLRAALKAEPLAAEATLRFAQVRRLLGDSGDARRALEPLVARDDVAPRIAYLARLLLARVLEADGDVARAADLYRQAIDRLPSASSARMGLARLLHADGDAGQAAQVLRPALGAQTDPATQDPWREYLVGHAEEGPALREALRREVRQ